MWEANKIFFVQLQRGKFNIWMKASISTQKTSSCCIHLILSDYKATEAKPLFNTNYYYVKLRWFSVNQTNIHLYRFLLVLAFHVVIVYKSGRDVLTRTLKMRLAPHTFFSGWIGIYWIFLSFSLIAFWTEIHICVCHPTPNSSARVYSFFPPQTKCN